MSFDNRVPTIRELGFREDKIPDLKAYIDLLWSANADLNLFSRKMQFEELIDNHLIDCLLPLSLFPTNIAGAADFGTGGGLPGVAYAIQFPDSRFYLFEKSPKKQEFLRRCQKIAPNIVVRGEIPKQLEGVDVVMARAFKPLEVILEMSRDYYKSGGKYFLLKGRRSTIDQELSLALKKFKDLKSKVVPLNSPVLDVERHLVCVPS